MQSNALYRYIHRYLVNYLKKIKSSSTGYRRGNQGGVPRDKRGVDTDQPDAAGQSH